jgi:hypothetical protein
MRTTLDIDDDVLRAAKELAAAKQTTTGRILSDLARTTLTKTGTTGDRSRNGFPLLSKRGAVVTVELVDRLADEP